MKRNIFLLVLFMIVFSGFIDVDAKILCKRATQLHTEICNSEWNSYFCSGSGYKKGETISYGNLGTNEILTTGDAFDCDVNGDGEYDGKRERFYYLTETDSNNSVLIYYSNVYQGIAYIDKSFPYNSNITASLGPLTAKEQLPTEEFWKNITIKPGVRNIIDEKGNLISSDFNYSTSVARLLTYQELEKACGSITLNKTGILDSCSFLLEATAYQKDNKDLSQGTASYGFWLENIYSANNNNALAINVMGRTVSPLTKTSSGVGVRPVIEVGKDEIQYSNYQEDTNDKINKRVQTVEVEDTISETSIIIKIIGAIVILFGLTIILKITVRSKIKIN